MAKGGKDCEFSHKLFAKHVILVETQTSNRLGSTISWVLKEPSPGQIFGAYSNAFFELPKESLWQIAMWSFTSLERGGRLVLFGPKR